MPRFWRVARAGARKSGGWRGDNLFRQRRPVRGRGHTATKNPLSSSSIGGLSFDGRGFRRSQSAATKTRHTPLLPSVACLLVGRRWITKRRQAAALQTGLRRQLFRGAEDFTIPPAFGRGGRTKALRAQDVLGFFHRHARSRERGDGNPDDDGSINAGGRSQGSAQSWPANPPRQSGKHLCSPTRASIPSRASPPAARGRPDAAGHGPYRSVCCMFLRPRPR